jgi:hypothetical protein
VYCEEIRDEETHVGRTRAEDEFWRYPFISTSSSKGCELEHSLGPGILKRLLGPSPANPTLKSYAARMGHNASYCPGVSAAVRSIHQYDTREEGGQISLTFTSSWDETEEVSDICCWSRDTVTNESVDTHDAAPSHVLTVRSQNRRGC